MIGVGLSKPFLSLPGPLYQNEVKCSAFDMEMIFHSRTNKSHFHEKGCALGRESEGFWNSEVAYLNWVQLMESLASEPGLRDTLAHPSLGKTLTVHLRK